MPETINQNLCTWIEAAISMHLRTKMPLDKVTNILMGRVFSALMLYWRYDVPKEWKMPTMEAICTWVGFKLRDYTLLDDSINDFVSVANPIYAALEKGDWQSFIDLPDPAWKWASFLSGIEKNEWKNLAELTSAELDTWIKCPACAWDGKLEDIGEVTEAQDPFSDAGSSSLHIRCSHCSSTFKFNVATKRVKQPEKGWDYFRIAIVALCALCILLPIAALLFYLLK